MVDQLLKVFLEAVMVQDPVTKKFPVEIAYENKEGDATRIIQVVERTTKQMLLKIAQRQPQVKKVVAPADSKKNEGNNFLSGAADSIFTLAKGLAQVVLIYATSVGCALVAKEKFPERFQATSPSEEL